MASRVTFETVLRATIATGVAVCAVCCFGVRGGFSLFDPPDIVPIAFDNAGLKAATPIANHRTMRSQMVDDLVARKLLDDLDCSQVEELLGPAVTDGRYGLEPRWDWVYLVGLERLGDLSLDLEFLVIRLSPVGKVAEYRNIVT